MPTKNAIKAKGMIAAGNMGNWGFARMRYHDFRDQTNPVRTARAHAGQPFASARQAAWFQS